MILREGERETRGRGDKADKEDKGEYFFIT
jgi:hypothetical protein